MPTLTAHIKILTVVASLVLTAILVQCGQFSEKPPYTIAVFLSETDYSEQDMELVRKLISEKLKELNNEGGINGRHLQVNYYDDEGDTVKFKQQLAKTITNENLIAYIGGLGISRARAAGPLVTSEKITYLGNYVYTNLTTRYPTVYTTGLGLKEGSAIFGALARAKSKKLGFIGQGNSPITPSSQQFLKGIQRLDPADTSFALTYHNFIPFGYTFTDQELEILADSLRNNVDFLVYSGGEKIFTQLIKGLNRHNVQIPVFCGWLDIAQLDTGNPDFYASELYDFDSYGIPGTKSKRLEEKLAVLDRDLLPANAKDYQLGLAASYADLIGLLREAALQNNLPSNAPMRQQVADGLKQYLSGHKVYRGWCTDWYFTPERASAASVLVAWKPRNSVTPILAPDQFIPSDSGLQKAQVLYTSLNMASIDQVNDEVGTFLATFYLQIHSKQPVIFGQIDFSNAARNTVNHQPLLQARLIRSQKDPGRFGFYTYLYKISGKFTLEPDLHKYPLDKQLFPISLQASNAHQPFLIQPASVAHRDTAFDSPGWGYESQFVGFDYEIISSANAFSLEQKNIPYYNFTFAFALKRKPIDYFLKTLMPLLTILTIAYFSVYIPPREFEALTAIQVTALLSSIALYFSTYKPEIQYATSSDKIFIFSYVMVTTLIGSSILIYLRYQTNKNITRAAMIYQRVLFPLIVLGFTLFIRLS